jgi:hypothetical protein
VIPHGNAVGIVESGGDARRAGQRKWVCGKLGVASRTDLPEYVDAPARSLQPVRE